MKHYISILGLAAVFFAVFSCGGPKDAKQADFDRPEKIECDSIAIEQILAPTSWTVNKDKVVILSPKTDSLFFVYQAPDFQYLYSFGRAGGGPEDYQYPRFIPDVSGKGRLLISSLMKVSDLTLGDKDAKVAGKERFQGYLMPNLIVNDSVVLAQQTTFDDNVLRAFYRTADVKKDNRTIDSVQVLINTKGFKIETSGSGIRASGQIYNSPRLVAKNGKMALIYPDVRRIDIFEISPDGKISLVKSEGEVLTLEQIQALDISERQKGEDVFDAQAGDDYMYVFTYDYENMGTWRKSLNSYMEVYDWEGNRVKKFDLGRPFTRFLIDEARGKIYCYHSGYDFENVYVYDYSL